MRPSQAPDLAIAPSLRWTAFIPVNAIGAWLGVSFVLGASARTIPTGALGGLVGLVSAVGAYYLFIGILGEGFRAIGASHAAMVWGAVALLAGPLFGLGGGTWRHAMVGPRAISVALLAAAWIGEGVYFGAGRHARLDALITDPGALVLAAEVALGVALPWLLLGRGDRLRGYIATFALAAVAVAAIGPVVTFSRGIADRF